MQKLGAHISTVVSKSTLDVLPLFSSNEIHSVPAKGRSDSPTDTAKMRLTLTLIFETSVERIVRLETAHYLLQSILRQLAHLTPSRQQTHLQAQEAALSNSGHKRTP